MGLDMQFYGFKKNRRRPRGAQKIPMGEMISLGYFRGCRPLHRALMEQVNRCGENLYFFMTQYNGQMLQLYAEDIEAVLDVVEQRSERDKQYRDSWDYGSNKAERKEWDKVMLDWAPDIKRTLKAMLKWVEETGDPVFYYQSW